VKTSHSVVETYTEVDKASDLIDPNFTQTLGLLRTFIDRPDKTQWAAQAIMYLRIDNGLSVFLTKNRYRRIDPTRFP
jgi:hypothetical protein